jgi:hypothetical protein
MITPYSPPQGPRVELLRVRRVDPTAPIERAQLSPLHDPGDLVLTQPMRVDRVEISDEARRLLARDLQTTSTGDTP